MKMNKMKLLLLPFVCVCAIVALGDLEIGEEYPISSWTFMRAEQQRPPEVVVKEWKDLGFTHAMSPILDFESKEHGRIRRMLDLCLENGLKLIIHDRRAHWYGARGVLKDDSAYRKNLDMVKAEWASHPACAGFVLTDEPSVREIDETCKAARLMKEAMPDKMCFLNLLPWYGWIGPRLGSDSYGPYLDRVAKDTGLDTLCYDYYDHMAEDRGEGAGFDGYFENLREWREFTQRNPGRRFWYTPLSVDSATRVVRTQADFRWQISTAAAMGAKGLVWYYVDLSCYHGMGNAGNAPINVFGERTEYFNWLSEENRRFQQQFGSEFMRLKTEEVFMVGFDKPRGGVKPFAGDADVLSVSSDHAPVLVSFFGDGEGGRYVALVNLSRKITNRVTLGLADGVRPKRLNRFKEYKQQPVVPDPVLARRSGKASATSWNDYLAAGQLVLLKLR